MFLKKLLVTIIIVIVTCILAGNYFDHRYKKRWENFFFSKPEEAINGKTNYDILFFGNSRIHAGINPLYIDSILKTNSYNFGIGSGDEQEMKMLATTYLQHHTAPKYVFIGVDNSMLTKYNVLKERFVYLYYLENDTVKSFMQKNGFPTTLINTLPFFKYSFFDEYNRTSIFNGAENINSKDVKTVYKGYFNVFPEVNLIGNNNERSFYKTLPTAEKTNDTSAAILKETVRMFLSKKAKVILLYTPVRKIRKGELLSTSDSFFIRLKEDYNLPVIYADTSVLFEEKYFSDQYHLNQPGAKVLSTFVAEQLKSIETN